MMYFKRVFFAVATLIFSGSASEPDGEQFRPLYHFTPRRGWTNDPNGMNYLQEPRTGTTTNHLFYQANPNSTAAPWSPPWEPAYWGHAVSPDLVNWKEVRASAIRGGSGAILVLPPKMRNASGGVVAIAFSPSGLWTTRNIDELVWQPPQGCIDAGPPSGKITCNASAMNQNRPGAQLAPATIDVSGAGDPTVAWISADGKLYSVFASSTHAAQYQALLFRTLNDSDPFAWEFVSILWRAPPSQTNPKMGFTNCPDFFQLPDGRWVFAYLTHATSYSPYRILWFIGHCDASWHCDWKDGFGLVDASSSFIASQSFTDVKGRRVIMGWIPMPGYTISSGGVFTGGFAGGQSIPRVIVADSNSSLLRFLPLPELNTLHGEGKVFRNIGLSPSLHIIETNTTNSFHLNLTLALSNSTHRNPMSASVVVQVLGASNIQVMPPYSAEGQKVLNNTDTDGALLELINATSPSQATSEWCGGLCRANLACGAWTLQLDWKVVAQCKLKHGGGRATIGDVGSGCRGEGVAQGKPICISGMVDWQLWVHALKQPVPVVLRPDGTVGLEIFVDKVSVEVFLHDGRGDGAAVSTFVQAADKDTSCLVGLAAKGAMVARAEGKIWPMHGSISPPPSSSSNVELQLKPVDVVV